MKIKIQPYDLLLFTSLLLAVLSFFVVGKHSTVDVHFHDTYFVVGHVYIVRLLSLITLLIWCAYLVVKNRLPYRNFTWAHTVMNCFVN